ncbi:MAG: (2Fe-2S)-binding protein [Wenzhouxiangellaceae bacterium]|nr:(2Fe-2S)-binding protein [Wenzhouxiangellaceae bacterium]
MFICICNAVTDREIREHAARGVETLEELRMRTGCSDCCGHCADEAEAILDSSRAHAAAVIPMFGSLQNA